MPKTAVTVTDATGAEVEAMTTEPEAFNEGRNIPVADRPAAPENQLVGPPTEPLVQ